MTWPRRSGERKGLEMSTTPAAEKQNHSREQFLKELQAKAAQQAQLESRRIFPSWLDPITAVIGNNPWQVIACLSGLSAVATLLIWEL